MGITVQNAEETSLRRNKGGEQAMLF